MKKPGILSGLIFALFTFSSSLSAQPTYIGEVCFFAGEDPEDGTTLQLAITHMGASHFSLNGVELRDGVSTLESELYDGTAEIIGDQFVMMINTLFNNPVESYGGKFHVRISLNTLEGTSAGTNLSLDKNTQLRGIEYVEGVMRIIACPG